MSSFSPDSLLLPHRVWKVKFVGESHGRWAVVPLPGVLLPVSGGRGHRGSLSFP